MNRTVKPVAAFCILLSIFLALPGCGGTPDPASFVVLPPDSILIPVLVDVQLAEAALKSFKPSERDSLAALYYERIARQHQCSKDDVMEWLNLLNTHPELMETVGEKVLDGLNRQDAKDPSDE